MAGAASRLAATYFDTPVEGILGRDIRDSVADCIRVAAHSQAAGRIRAGRNLVVGRGVDRSPPEEGRCRSNLGWTCPF